ncbi:hypothetical protein B9Z51_12885 [Limnohabitans sp. T6-5]|uniref:TOBE domain-containing protein n=1 Tax=Limnohabitans sp. T6-5 TaxID=1100724 RepID=UPI000D36EF6F|nr:TOBE domain-containing protein [Limnohabitans sp. T6-5]PUE06824.1 hypothetical protein B9Z51_12885 [Limnohabitans sp. T6-5]
MDITQLHVDKALSNEVVDKRLDILRRIGDTGSISEAARQAGVSYKGAWQAIDTLTNLAGTALLHRNVGGSGGGGATLTAAGVALLEAAEQLNAAKRAALQKLNQGIGPQAGERQRYGALSLRTSMRNQFPCSIGKLQKSGSAVRVELRLPGKTSLFSRVTQESVELLNLQAGDEVFALCKATAVSVSTSEHAHGNAVHGVVTRASRGRATGEIGLLLDCGLQMVGFAQAGFELKVRQRAVANFEETAVVIALP